MGPCAPCPVGTYQPNAGKTRCLACGDEQTTPNEGIPDQYQCTNSGKCLLCLAYYLKGSAYHSNFDLRLLTSKTLITEIRTKICKKVVRS